MGDLFGVIFSIVLTNFIDRRLTVSFLFVFCFLLFKH